MDSIRMLCLAGSMAIGMTAGGCQQQPDEQAGSGKLVVAVTIAPQAWVVGEVGGARVEVRTLVAPSAEPETFQPTDAEVAAVMGAVVYFRIGVPVEQGRWFDAVGDAKKIQIVDMRRGIPLRTMADHGPPPESSDRLLLRGHGHGHDPAGSRHHAHDGQDPHVWLCPRLLKMQARVVAETLIQLDASGAGQYRSNLQTLETKLDGLDQAIRDTLLPHKGKAFLVFHPAWGYFADEYGLLQIAVESAGKIPSDHALTRLQKTVRDRRLRVIFVSPQRFSQTARSAAQALGVELQQLDPLARDVAVNLLAVAQAIAHSYR